MNIQHEIQYKSLSLKKKIYKSLPPQSCGREAVAKSNEL